MGGTGSKGETQLKHWCLKLNTAVRNGSDLWLMMWRNQYRPVKGGCGCLNTERNSPPLCHSGAICTVQAQLLGGLWDIVLGSEQQDHGEASFQSVSLCGTMCFHCSIIVRYHPRIPFFSSWRWEVYDCKPSTRESLWQACNDIGVEACRAWIRDTRSYFPRCLARENVVYDVEEVLWPEPAHRCDAVEVDEWQSLLSEWLFFLLFFTIGAKQDFCFVFQNAFSYCEQ